MASHEEFLELCAAATAGELTADEELKLKTHLATCSECRLAKAEYDLAAAKAVVAFAQVQEPLNEEKADPSWSVGKAEEAFFRRLEKDEKSNNVGINASAAATVGKRFVYRPSRIPWREIWMPFAAAILLAVALGIAAYRTGMKRGADIAQTQPFKETESSLEAQVSDAAHEHTQLQAKLAESTKIIDGLRQQVADQIRIVNSLKSAEPALPRSTEANRSSNQVTHASDSLRDQELFATQKNLAELEKAVEAATAQRDESAQRAAALEAKVNELTQLVRAREETLDQRDAEVAKGQELLEHDRDIRELMGARELYMADVHDVSGKGTDKTYGRVFYTKGRRLIFYAFDLDAQPGIQNASTFQAWGRNGPDRQQARSLGIFYEDNVSKKRWVLKAEDPKTLEDIDAVFVTVEPRGGSAHPSGKQLLFAYLRVNPNHP